MLISKRKSLQSGFPRKAEPEVEAHIFSCSQGPDLGAQLVKNPPTMRETWVLSLGWEGLLEKGTLPTPVFWPGEFHELYSPWGRKESDTTERLSLSLRTGIPGRQEGGREEADSGRTVSRHLLVPGGAEQVCPQNRDL